MPGPLHTSMVEALQKDHPHLSLGEIEALAITTTRVMSTKIGDLSRGMTSMLDSVLADVWQKAHNAHCQEWISSEDGCNHKNPYQTEESDAATPK